MSNFENLLFPLIQNVMSAVRIISIDFIYSLSLYSEEIGYLSNASKGSRLRQKKGAGLYIEQIRHYKVSARSKNQDSADLQ
ncbi:hypothetical protein N879_08760 [Alcaligenes sp. EGD-AK7]|nr:hypothetical protein N879_08760 [Alcaligenes sp. EGD-AK7]